VAKKLLIEEVKEIFQSEACVLTSEVYVNSKTPLVFICNCGREDAKSLDKFKRKPSCKYCSLENRDQKRRLDIHQVKTAFENNGCILLENKYINTKTKMKCLCKCGKETMLRYEDIIARSHCYECRNAKIAEHFTKYSIEDVKSILFENNCTLISNTFKNTSSKIKYICKCGRLDEKVFSSFLSGSRCMGCANDERTGEKSPRWKHDKTDEERVKERKFRDYEIWRKQVFERDYYTCKSCDKVGGSLVGHHLDGWHWCKEKRLDINNGVTLCSICHDDFHEMYGKHWNKREQFDEWYENKRNKRKDKDAS
jgi:hypothetical protein